MAVGGWPGVAEIYYQPVSFAGGEKLRETLYVVIAEQHVVRLLIAEGLPDIPAANAQYVIADVYAHKVHLGLRLRRRGKIHALAAAQVQV